MKSIKIAAAFAATLALAGACNTPADPNAPPATECEKAQVALAKAQQVANFASVALSLVCTKQSAACDQAGMVLKAANEGVRIATALAVLVCTPVPPSTTR